MHDRGDFMSTWYDKPTKILLMRKDIDYAMCIDENGSSSNLTYVLKQISNDKELSEDDKYFTITKKIQRSRMFSCNYTRNKQRIYI